ncbi:hypothetical protein AKO1_008253 [Acrasis kona]|uniref:TRAF-type domain-containing protein n=1 Tax=Acrasis kona TaxID=1008807 RepID=A0AAW2YPK6_9EUKA
MSTSPTKTKSNTDPFGDFFTSSTSTSPQVKNSILTDGTAAIGTDPNTEDVNFARCKLCFKIVHNNRECRHCHSLFCNEHIKNHLKTSDTCPVCSKSPVSLEGDFDHNFLVQRIVNDLNAPCPLGCGQKVHSSDAQSHSNVCEKLKVTCPMRKYGCTWNGERSQARSHIESSCPYFAVKNVLESYEEKLLHRDQLAQQQKKYWEGVVLKKDLQIMHLNRELQQAQQTISQLDHSHHGHHSKIFSSNEGLHNGSAFSGTHSLFGDMPHSKNQLSPSQLSDLIISPQNKSTINHQKKPFENVIQKRLFAQDNVVSMSPINGFNIMSDIVDSPDDDQLDDEQNFVDRVIKDMEDNHSAHESIVLSIPPSASSSSSTPSSYQDIKSDPRDLYLLAGGGVGSIKVWDINEPEECIMSLKGHTRFVSALYTHKGKVCSGSGDTSIRLWDFSTGECEKMLTGCDGKVGALCSYGDLLVSGSKDGATNHKIRLWNTEKNVCVRTLQGHSDWINVLTAHDKMLFSGSGDRTVRIWDLEKGKCLVKYENPSFVLSLYHHADHHLLYCGTYDGMIRTWDLRANQKVIRTVKAHASGVLSLAHHDNMLCSGSKDETIRVWDYRTLGGTSSCVTKQWTDNSVRTFVGHNNAVKCLISYNQKYLASGSYDRTVKLWDVSAGGPQGGEEQDVSVMTIETGFKVYSLCTFSE